MLAKIHRGQQAEVQAAAVPRRAIDLVGRAPRRQTPPQYPHLVEDLFETITLFENRAASAKATKRADGKYDVTVDVRAKKLRAGETGVETEVPIDDYVDVGVARARRARARARARRGSTPAEATFVLTVDEAPEKAGIDPLDKLIDRMPDDNVTRVAVE